MSKDRSHRLETGRSTTKLADGQNDDASSGTSTKTSQLQRQVRFYRSESVLFRKQKKTRGTLPNQTVAPLANKKKILPLKIKSASLRQQLEWTASRKNILNSRTCNIRNTGVCRHQRQPLELHVRYCEILTTANS